MIATEAQYEIAQDRIQRFSYALDVLADRGTSWLRDLQVKDIRDQIGVSRLGPREPGGMETRLRGIRDVVRDVTRASGIVRTYLIQPTDGRFARVVYAAFYEGDADDMLTFRRGSATQSICLDRREPVLLRVVALDEAAWRAPATQSIHALRPANVRHVYFVPMFAEPGEWAKADPSTEQIQSRPSAPTSLRPTNASSSKPTWRMRSPRLLTRWSTCGWTATATGWGSLSRGRINRRPTFGWRYRRLSFTCLSARHETRSRRVCWPASST